MAAPQGERLRDTVTRLLDDGYQQAAQRTVRAISNNMNSGILQIRLEQLEAEAERLEQAGERMEPDNPVLRAFFADFEDVLAENRRAIESAATDLSSAGANAAGDLTPRLTAAGLPPNGQALITGNWNRPDPESIAALVDFTEDPEWGRLLRQYEDGMLTRVTDRATYGFINGWGPSRTARELRRLTQGADGAAGLSRSSAETIMRTVQLSSYRRGTAAYQAANSRILQDTAIRIAVLDFRTCLACVSLHGTRIPLGQPVKDHWNGRCTSVAVVRGFERNIQSGVDWFNSLPEDRQRQQTAFVQNPSYWDAWQDGAVQLEDFAVEASDPLFGDMVVQASLSGILGDDARRYYRR